MVFALQPSQVHIRLVCHGPECSDSVFVVNLFSLSFFFMVLVLLVLQSQFLFVFPVSLVESLCLLRLSCLYVSALVSVFDSLVFPVLL